MSTKYIIGNWKLNPATTEQAVDLATALRDIAPFDDCQLGVTPSLLQFASVHDVLGESKIWVGVQNVSHLTAQTGAYTGDVSAAQIADAGADFVIIGHSERRAYFGEDAAILTQKLSHCQKAGLPVVYCIGETQEQYDDAKTLSVLDEQLSILADIGFVEGQLLVAYEPVWAIGTGRTPTVDEVEQVHQHIKKTLQASSLTAPVLYGGSVNATNAEQFGASKWVDGALVGGASLDAQSFVQIATAFAK